MTSQSVSNETSQVIHDFTVNQKLISGNTILIVYYLLMLTFFIFETLLNINAKEYQSGKTAFRRGPVRKFLYDFYTRYRAHSYLTIDLILFGTCMVMILLNGHVSPREIVGISMSILLFGGITRLFMRVFLGTNDYTNDNVSNYINLIFYILLGTYFCYFVSFVSKPNLILAFAGLIFALYLCFSIMLRSIFNPMILQKKTSERLLYNEAYGILKGMFGLLLCELIILYMMVYACWATNPDFYMSTIGKDLDAWDMLYYMMISFSTIGYGDIVPVRPDGAYYASFTAIVISFCAFFSSACFAGAVISSANTIAQKSRQAYKEQVIKDPNTSDSLEDNLKSDLVGFAQPVKTLPVQGGQSTEAGSISANETDKAEKVLQDSEDSQKKSI